MKKIQSVKNQYYGINPHLHSALQAQGRWGGFHTYHIGHLLADFRQQLIPAGYTAHLEESLQIRRVWEDAPPRRPKSDLIITDQFPNRFASGAQSAKIRLPALTLDQVMDDNPEDYEHPYMGIGIYERVFETQTLGEPVAWVEMLSPTNKGNTDDARTYRAKRRILLGQGIVFLEIVYLHETPPTLERLKDYGIGEDGAHPYRVVVIDPRPRYRDAKIYLQEFDVDTPIPTMDIPLNGDDVLTFDFDSFYQQKFAEPLFGYDIDYAQLPMNFDRYSLADQGRIAARMIAILEAVMRGEDLERDPLPVQPITTQDELQAALTRIEGLKQSLAAM